MRDRAAKRFWTTVEVRARTGGWCIALDGRPVKTPAKAALVLPTAGVARAVAREWEAVETTVDPAAMPFTRAANAAIDKVARQRDEVIGLLAEYGASDLLCYRADGPEGLVAGQRAAWDPVLDWAAGRFSGRLKTTVGVIPVAQDPRVLGAMRSALVPLSDFQLTAAHDLIALSGSLVLACAVMERHLDPETAWTASRIDEDWQTGEWGTDAAALAEAKARRADFLRAAELFRLSGDTG